MHIMKITRTRFTVTAIASALALGLALTGCSTGGSNSGTAADKPAATAETPAKVDNQLVFGETFTYDDGVAMTVATPVAYTPGQYAAGADLASNVAIAFTVVNGSNEVLSLLSDTSVTSGGTAASSITDLENSAISAIGGSADVLPGQSYTWTQAYSLADGTDVTVAVAPTFGYESAYWTF